MFHSRHRAAFWLIAVIGSASSAQGYSAEELKKAKDVRALSARLGDKAPDMRLQAARALREVMAGVKSEADLKHVLSPLVTATLKDSSADVRENARFALRITLSKIEDDAALIPVAEAFLAGLEHKDATVRAHCAHDLSNVVVGKINDAKALKRMLGRLTAATLKAESMDAADFPGFALRIVLRKTDDEAALIPVMESSLVGLKHKDSTMRAYFAHALAENMANIEDDKTLVRTVRPLTAAALKLVDSVDSKTSDVRARDSAYFALKQVLGKVDDQAALRSIIEPMAEALKASQVTQRQYSAHMVMLFAHKVENQAALMPLVRPLVRAHFHDPDENVRVQAALALKKTFGSTPEPDTTDS